MQGSLGHLIWTVCYLSVLIGLSAYGVHRYFIIYLFLKNRKREPVPERYFEQLPKVTVQLPIFNEIYVVERLLRSVSELDYPRELLQIQVLDDSTDDARRNCALAALMSNAFIASIALVLKPGRWLWDSRPRKGSSFVSSMPILLRSRIY
jgi:cellulose synthase/poly-beta-1,6-N-acetylglucosamine synthase-like glycosyltransferase